MDGMSQQPYRQSLQNELCRLIEQFPHPRNRPMEAVLVLARIREIQKELTACQQEQDGPVPGQDAQS